MNIVFTLGGGSPLQPSQSSPQATAAPSGAQAQAAASENNELAVLMKKAQSGDAAAQSRLGGYYFLAKDYAHAAVWYRKAAEQGDTSAPSALGYFSFYGEGVPQDYAQAAIWYRKSAEQGNADSQMHLGALYAEGSGVPQDYAEAYFWLNIALAGNIKDAVLRESIVKVRDGTANRLAPNKLQEVQSRATKWFVEHTPSR
jgi:TPR repeat protein